MRLEVTMAHSAAELAHLRVGQFVAEQMPRKEQDHDAPPPSRIPPDRRIITISRQYGAGGHTIAELVAKRLGPQWEIWDQELVDAVAKSANVRAALISTLDERALTKMEEFLRYVTNLWSITPDHYHRHLVQVLMALSQQGDKIIIGRGANYVIKNALRVRLFASELNRIKAIMERESVSEAKAKEHMARIEAERAQFVHSLYHSNVYDPAGYDLIIQADHLKPDPAAAAIAAAMQTVCEGAANPKTVAAA
jgi:cytidylate kinase